MREILFRGKHYRTKKWVYGIFIKNAISNNEGAYYPQIIPEIHGVHNTVYACSVVEETVGEFTGLTDRNEAKIFEGDIVQYIDNSGKMLGIVCFGAYEDCDEDTPYHRGFFIKWKNSLIRCEIGFWAFEREIEVIGNIYDNPELLGGDDNAAD